MLRFSVLYSSDDGEWHLKS